VNDVAQTALPVVECKQEGERQALLVLDTSHGAVGGHAVGGRAVGESYVRPGQYVRLTLEDGVARPFAIASPPPAPGSPARMEFLVKAPAERMEALLALSKDDKVLSSLAQGPGFPLELARSKSLWMFCGGTGVAPLRAVIETALRDRTAFKDIHLFYGARTRDELCFQERFGAWAGHGVEVVPVLSRAPTSEGWGGRTGYVQEHLPTGFARPADVVVFVCGVPEMERDVQAALLERGVGADQVFRNW
jgi:NAD(P)H-flavin reductase